jgi:E3 ubiquitin-protein ligase synoviolin
MTMIPTITPRTRKILTLAVFLGAIISGMYQNYYQQSGQFYPAMRQLARNNQAMMLGFFFWLCFMYLSTKGFVQTFFGDLRAIEQENVNQNFWLSVTDTALTMTIFHDDLQKEAVTFVILFTVLLSVKVIHWLFHDRVDFMETSPQITWSFRFRMLMIATVLICLDAFTLWWSYEKIMQRKDYWLVFANEYALLAAFALHVLLKFVLHSVDLASRSPWENKNNYMMYIRLVFCAIKLCVQVVFVFMLTKRVQFPLYAIRPCFQEAKELRNTIKDIVKSRKAIKRMESFPDATMAEFADVDKDTTCIICHEEMVTGEGAARVVVEQLKKLPCGHIFHAGCLRRWFLRQQTCPICRRNVLEGEVPAGGNGLNQAGQAGVRVGPRGNNAQVEAQRIHDLIRNLQAQARNGNANVPLNVGGAGVPPVAGATPAPGAPNVNIAGANIIQSEFTISGLPTVSVNNVPFTVPVPKPPVNVEELAKLELHELRAMEGDERMAIARRIAYLRDVRSMCDATLTMMSQYQSVMGPEVKPDASTNKKSGDDKKSEPEIIEKSSPKTVSQLENKSESKLETAPSLEKSSPKTEPKVEAEPVFEETSTTENPESTSENVCDSTNKTEPTETPNSEANELRRRRIQALSQSQ